VRSSAPGATEFGSVERARSKDAMQKGDTALAAAAACGAAGAWQAAGALVEEARRNLNVGLANSAGKTKAFTVVLAALGRGRCWEAALALLAEMQRLGPEPNAITVSAAISACQQGSSWAAALALLLGFARLAELRAADSALRPNEVQGPGPELWPVSFGAALGACSKAGLWRHALQLLADMAVERLRPGLIAFSVAMRCCELQGEWQQALALLPRLSAACVRPDVMLFGTAISACERGEHWAGALQLLEELRAHRLQSNVVVYSAAVSSCAKAGRADWSEVLLEEMHRESVAANAITYNAAITAAEKGRRWELALSILGRMRLRGIKPDLISCNAATSACEKGTVSWAAALGLLAAARRWKLQPSCLSYNAAVSACEKGLQWQSALRLLRELSSLALQSSVVTFNAAMSACASESWAWPLLLLSELRRQGLTPNAVTCSALVTGSGKNAGAAADKTLEVALQLLRSSGGEEPNNNNNKDNNNNKEEGGGPDNNNEEEEEALRHSNNNNFLFGDPVAYTATLQACGQARLWAEALQLLGEMQSQGLQPTVLACAAAVAACGHHGRHQESLDLCRALRGRAQVLLRRSHKAALCGQGPAKSATSVALSALPKRSGGSAEGTGLGQQEQCLHFMRDCQGTGSWEKAIAALRVMLAAGGIEVNQMLGFSIACATCKEAGEWAVALGLMEAASSRRVALNEVALGAVLAACGRRGRWQECLALLRKGEPRSVFGCNAALLACERRNEWVPALALLRDFEVLRAAPDAVSVNTAVSACGKAAEWSWATNVLRELSRAARLRTDVIGVNSAMSSLGTASEWRTAIHLLLDLRTQGLQATASSCNAVCKAFADVAMWRPALLLLEAMCASFCSSSSSANYNIYSNKSNNNNNINNNNHNNNNMFSSPSSPCLAWPAPDVLTVNVVLSGLDRGGHLGASKQTDAQRCAALWLLWEDAGPLAVGIDGFAFVAAASACEEVGRWREALALLCAAKAIGREPPGLELWATVCSACTKGAEWEKAVLLFAELQSAGLQPDAAVYGAVLQALASGIRGGSWPQALELASRSSLLRAAKPGLACNFGLAACEVAKQWEPALALVQLAGHFGVSSDLQTFGMLVSSCQAEGQWARALTLMADMRRQQLTANAVVASAAVGAAAAAGRWPVAAGLLASMRTARLELNEASCGAALQACAASASGWPMALSLLWTMGSWPVEPNLPILASAAEAARRGSCWIAHASTLSEVELL
ncbi:unnamed protein product, partial [Polarella glacialis]